MTKRRLVCTCVFGVLGAFLATDHAQAQSIDAATRHARPQTTAQALWERGFGPGLLSYGEALKSNDPKVRGLAAMKIVEDKQNPAIATVESDVHDIEVIFVKEEDDIVNPIGAKGLGEIGLVGVAAAIGNAIYNATGKRIRELPITLDKLI